MSSLVDDDTEAEKQQNATKITTEREIEDQISRDISDLQNDGIRSIANQYLEMLKMKVDELERVKSELSEDNSDYEILQQDTEHWKKLWQKATWNLPQYKDAFGRIDIKCIQNDQEEDEKGQKEQEKPMPINDKEVKQDEDKGDNENESRSIKQDLDDGKEVERDEDKGDNKSCTIC